MNADTHIAIVGAGQAAVSLAAKLRALGFAGRLTVIGEEPFAPYQRPALSKKYLLGEMSAERSEDGKSRAMAERGEGGHDVG